MQYPQQFSKSSEKNLILILKQLQEEGKKITTLHEFDRAIKLIVKRKNLALPALWHFRFILGRHKDLFTSTFIANLKSILVKTQVRSWSGIVPVSIFTAGVGCPFHCIYCANEPDMPKSYFSDEPSVMRAVRFKFDPYKQVLGRLQMFYLSGHPLDKIDLIIQGGTFSFYDRKYREWFLKRCYDAANTSIETLVNEGRRVADTSRTLQQAQFKNETAQQRIIGVTIETRPDYITENELQFLRKLGVTRVEIGVQAPDDKILETINRGHGVEEIVKATRLLRSFGFKITYHLMPGLPGSSLKKDITMLKEIFTNPKFKPDNIKFYPTSVVKYSPLEQWFKDGKYKPYDNDTLTKLVLEFKKNIVPRWLRIQRLVRDLTVNDIVYDTFPSNFRQNIESELRKKRIRCMCIRCREIKNDLKLPDLSLKILNYKVNGGTENFLEYVDKNDRLYGLLRLYVSDEKKATIRELHVYGGALAIGKYSTKQAQHQGLGTKLIQEAENIVRKEEIPQLSIIAGVGTREYYRKFGYTLKQTYMTKTLP
ncbi:MAG: tRNA uridine(34) 5-carboxymethylaminomethyl modification radical SAM/GNAT enzyme Elp3 [Patescibacteria group bacterium]|jgi:elongator complex protein 3